MGKVVLQYNPVPICFQYSFVGNLMDKDRLGAKKCSLPCLYSSYFQVMSEQLFSFLTSQIYNISQTSSNQVCILIERESVWNVEHVRNR